MRNRSEVDRIVETVLYEGYLLYPYRVSARKNRQRFTFGRVYPETFSEARDGLEPGAMQTVCLLHGASAASRVHVCVRFLQPMIREVGAISEETTDRADDGDIDFTLVPEVTVDGVIYFPWHECVERSVNLTLSCLERQRARSAFSFSAQRRVEPLRDARGVPRGVFVRRRETVRGLIETEIERTGEDLLALTVRIRNLTPVPDASDDEGVLLRSFASTHTVLESDGGAFLSLTDPPERCRAAAEGCRQGNIGTWPVLVGDPSERTSRTILSSPIILPDFPAIAPQSSGNYFDSTEIDEMLALRILTMTENEKDEMRGVDDYARQLLERTESLPSDDLMDLHGILRRAHTGRGGIDNHGNLEAAIFGSAAAKKSEAFVDGIHLRPGDRVRVRPKEQADAFDLMLAGRVASIEAIEEDAEGKLHFALVLEDDPGRELGLMRQPGHRFFYGAHEIEPLGAAKEVRR